MSRKVRALAWIAASLAVPPTHVSFAGELRALEVRLEKTDSTVRFVSREEWSFLSSFTDCPGQDGSAFGPATHPVVTKAAYREIVVKAGEQSRKVTFSLPQGAVHPAPAREWVLRKVVCGSRGFAVLYSDAFAYGRSFVLNRFDPQWNLVGTDIFTLPEVKFSGFPGGTNGRMPWRFTESALAFELVLLDIAENKDRSINSAEYVALARHQFSVAKRADTLSGYADRPGPALTAEYLASVPVQVAPGFKVPRATERHEVELGNWAGTATVDVQLGDRAVFLRLRAYQPMRWVLSGNTAQVYAVHLWGPPPQEIEGAPEKTVVLRFDQQGGSREQNDAIGRLSMLSEPARSVQKVPEHRKGEVVRVDGVAGLANAEPRRSLHHPDMKSGIEGEVQAKIANCASLKTQDERIECYRLRAELLRGRKGP